MEKITLCFGTVTGGRSALEPEPICTRFVRYLDDAHRDGVIGDARYAVAIGKAHKLQRFLTINSLSNITANEFTSDLVLEFRQFVYDEYLYVPKYPELYPGQGDRIHPLATV